MRAIAFAAIATLALAGCSQKVETKDGKTVVTTAGVQSTIEQGADAQAAANALPAYAPPYPGAQVVAATQSRLKDTQAAAVTMVTTDTPDQVVAFYKDRLAAAGLGQVSAMNMGIAQMVIVQDVASGKGVQVIVAKKDGGTQIQVTQSTSKPKA
jgi:hypothetical protein